MVPACVKTGDGRAVVPEDADQGTATNKSHSAAATSLASACRRAAARPSRGSNKAAQGGDEKAAYFAKHLSGNNFIGFRTRPSTPCYQRQAQIRPRLSGAGRHHFRNSGERNAYLMACGSKWITPKPRCVEHQEQ